MLQTITSTELRTKTKLLVDSIRRGANVRLVHRSQIIGTIQPSTTSPRLFNADSFSHLVSKLNLPTLSTSQIKKRYQRHLTQKYG